MTYKALIKDNLQCFTSVKLPVETENNILSQQKEGEGRNPKMGMTR